RAYPGRGIRCRVHVIPGPIAAQRGSESRVAIGQRLAILCREDLAHPAPHGTPKGASDMFFARPISLKTEVWDRIDAYLNEYAASHPGLMPNGSAFLEEAAVAFLDAKEAEASGASAGSESTDDMGLDLDTSTDDTSMDDTSTDELSLEETTEDVAGDES